MHITPSSSTLEPEEGSGLTRTYAPLLVFSHLRWHFVTQRPQHLLTRAARTRPVYFWEEPCIHQAGEAPAFVHEGGTLEFLAAGEAADVTVIRPHFFDGEDATTGQRRLLDQWLREQSVKSFDRWYYTPMALRFSAHLRGEVTIYDCMDELSAFRGAPAELLEREQELFGVADVVFTGGHSIYEVKRKQHANVHALPSSIDVQHFAQARTATTDPADQAAIPEPRVGFFGVLDERFDTALVGALAALRPAVQFVFLGPVVKLDPKELPQAANIHYLGMKTYQELPSYLAHWNAAMMPFARNDSTRFISPTKTPEFLAAGKRVVSTAIADVVADYGDAGLVEIASTPEEFAEALDRALAAEPDQSWSERVQRKLEGSSWDSTWAAMQTEIDSARRQRRARLSGSGLGLKSSEHARRAGKEFSRMGKTDFDYLVVGAGFAGSVVAERLASQLGKRVLVIDRRPHIGGNTYDFRNEDGILVHQYGPHIFHTSSEKVVDYLSQFTKWRPYEHRVLAHVDGKYLPIPINLETINKLYDLDLDADGMEKFLAARIESPAEVRTSEDIVVSRVGRELYEKFFRNYTRKQWGLDPSQLDSSVAGRIPVRFNRDDRYFTDTFQAMPLEGFTRLFERMLGNPNISIALSTDYRELFGQYPNAKIVYTGPIDQFFDYRYGRLPYRSLRFEHQTHDRAEFQPAPVVNYPNEHAYTRITEFKYLTGQEHAKTSVVYEYPMDEGEPYYPIPRPENAELYQKYRALADVTTGVYFCGRLANYKYFNMDQVVAQALHLYRNIAEDEASAAAQASGKFSDHAVMSVRQRAVAQAAG
ncbi:MAG: UDP-galactopyranose mutase [Acidobacteriota bacterium]|nr:UDP-galactopyranose mutase [Acidobacteriota bacterium]